MIVCLAYHIMFTSFSFFCKKNFKKSNTTKTDENITQYSIRNWNGGRNIIIDFITYCPEENTIYIDNYLNI